VNDEPGSPAWDVLADGLTDAGARLGPTFSVASPRRRIDAVLVDPGRAAVPHRRHGAGQRSPPGRRRPRLALSAFLSVGDDTSEEQPMDVHETPLPGIGLRHEFTTAAGRRVGLVSHRSGKRDLLLYDAHDPDAAREALSLTPEEAQTLATLLGAAGIAQELTALQQEVAGLRVEWLPLPKVSPYAGRTLGDTQARTRTGASIVAIARSGGVVPSPGPEHDLLAGDTLVVAGTPEGVAAVAELLEP
jgi:TrkA domain protein